MTRDDSLALTQALCKDAFEKEISQAPEIGDEAKALRMRYWALHKMLLKHPKFVIQNDLDESFVFGKGFAFDDFDGDLQLYLFELADTWEACPMCMAVSLIAFPRMYMRLLEIYKGKTEVVNEMRVKQYVRYHDNAVHRHKTHSFKYVLGNCISFVK